MNIRNKGETGNLISIQDSLVKVRFRTMWLWEKRPRFPLKESYCKAKCCRLARILKSWLRYCRDAGFWRFNRSPDWRCCRVQTKELAQQNIELFATPQLRYFLYGDINRNAFVTNNITIDNFINLDDNDISTAIKVWMQHDDAVLSTLSKTICKSSSFAYWV